MPIIISKNGKEVKSVERTSFKQEEELLKYISENPDCIPFERYKRGCSVCKLKNEFYRKNGT